MSPRFRFTLLPVLFAVCSGLACAPKGTLVGPPQGGGPAAPAKPRPADAKAWKVQDPPGPRNEVPIDVDEGTWMSLDVSADGETIVFDLLGDIYAVPVTGGDAKPLTEGIAWDMQPTYSPDGRWIAFTSDRGGGDNVWIMGADGSDPRQVTDEDFRLVNSPAWSPDGDYLAVRKHFTSERSLGAGEIWLYHRWGGKGLQVIKRPNQEKDLGEPAFSADGRYLFYSQDVTPGDKFEYNKNPHDTIYAIHRLDRADGHVSTWSERPGGAVRPTPSPDGRMLAYVRRVGTKTALVVEDLASGARKQISDGLDRDMQETWAIHGVYPRMAWTPDSASLVFWAGGKIHRVEVASGEERVIPFRVRHDRSVTPALRYPVEVHPERFDVKMLRWANVAPGGKSVVFQALGHLYVRALPDGQPERLTTDDDVFEYFPSYSRDGRQVVYVAWSDDDLASIRMVSSTGGPSRTITAEPGHYGDPVLSPDGETVVFTRLSPGPLQSQRWSRETGLFAVSLKEGRSWRIRRGGSSPHFGADPGRVYFLDVEKKGNDRKHVLMSIDLDGSDERRHVESKGALEFQVAPNDRWLAFQELFNVYVMPFPPVGQAYEIGPKMESVPVVQVSEDAGNYLHWAAQSDRLHWTLGPQLFTRDLDDAVPFLRGGEDTPAPPLQGVHIGFSVPSDRPTGKLVLMGARIVTMKGDEIIDNGVVVIDGNRIVAVAPAGQIAVPPDARLVDVSNTTIIPGLVDVHAHGPQGEHGVIGQQNWLHLSELAFGVTTVHDPAHATGTLFAAAEMARAGMITAPRIFGTGTVLYGAKSPITAEVETLEDARTHVRRMKAVGAFSVKSYNQPRRDQRQKMISAARELEMMVVPEGGSLFQHNMTMVVDGHTGIEHAIPVATIYDDVEQLWGATKVGYTPTMVVGYGGLWGENYWYAESAVHENERLRAFVPPEEYEPRTRRRVVAEEGDWNHVRIAETCKALSEAGVRVNLGAHGQREGLAAHWELWSFVQGGMTPLEALRAGTLNGAEYVGLDGDIGSIEVGKLADLVVIDGDPTQDIRASQRIRYTMVNGRLYEAATMNEVGNHPRARDPLYWQRQVNIGEPLTDQ